MAGITLAQAEAQLTLWIAASAAVASGQEYTIGDRTLRRADAGEVLSQIKFWQSYVVRLTPRTRGRTTYVVPE
jgi:hypothetical protein